MNTIESSNNLSLNGETNIMNDSIIFVTAYKDIGRKSWSHYSRDNQTYINSFIKLASNIQYKLVVYIEDEIFSSLKGYTFNSNIIFLSYNDVSTFYRDYLENEKKMINCDEYIRKCRPDRRIVNPEHWCAEYNLVNHSKINFVKHTKNLFPNYKYYSWIDFGCTRDRLEDIPTNIDFSKLNESITYLCLENIPNYIISANDMLKSDTVYLAGSQFVVNTHLVELFENLYRSLLEDWKLNNICDDDQNAVLQIYFKNRDLFKLFSDNEWFSLFRKHLNKYTN